MVCEYVTAEHGLAHVIAGGIDTLTVEELPAGQNMALWARVLLAVEGLNAKLPTYGRDLGGLR